MVFEIKDKGLIKRLSPSSINCYFQCPRRFYYKYILGYPDKATIHLFKGSVVHKVLEDAFKYYKPPLTETWKELFIKEWGKPNKIKDGLDPNELVMHRGDAWDMLTWYFDNLQRRMSILINVGKANNEKHAYYLIRPKFREKKLTCNRLGLTGFVDRIDKTYDNRICIADYKTSSKYGGYLSEDHERQLALYSLLYLVTFEVLPDKASVHYLRYGESYHMKITPSVIKDALETVKMVHQRTKTDDVHEYPVKEGGLCKKWCPYFEDCIKDRMKSPEEWKQLLTQKKSRKSYSKPYKRKPQKKNG